jgi:hypothetical protein
VEACSARVIAASLSFLHSQGICVASNPASIDKAAEMLGKNIFDELQEQLAEVAKVLDIYATTGKVSQAKKEKAIETLIEIETYMKERRGVSPLPDALESLSSTKTPTASWVWAVLFGLAGFALIFPFAVAAWFVYRAIKLGKARQEAIRIAQEAATVVVDTPEQVVKSLSG